MLHLYGVTKQLQCKRLWVVKPCLNVSECLCVVSQWLFVMKHKVDITMKCKSMIWGFDV